MPNQKVLLVDSDAKSQRVLEVSLKKAGFDVTTARTVEDAWNRALLAVPDVVITEADFAEESGFDLCRRLRDDPRTAGMAVVFLAQDGSPEAKIRAISAGADEYLTKPTFVKEILTRVGGLLERRQKDAMSAKDRPANFRGTLSGMGLVDIFQLIETGKKSGALRITSDTKRSGGLLNGFAVADVWFRDGRAIDAEVGKLRAEAAIYRLLLWDDGDFELEFSTPPRETLIHTPTQGLLLEGMRRVDEWSRLAPKVPPLHTKLDVDFRTLGSLLPSMPSEVEQVVRLFDGRRTLLDGLDDAPVDELTALGVVARLLQDKVLVDTARSRPSQAASPRTLEAWLAEPVLAGLDDQTNEVFAADILANLPSELTAAMYPSPNSASQLLAAADLPKLPPLPQISTSTVRPEPVSDEQTGSAILSRSTIPSGSSPVARAQTSRPGAPAIPKAPTEGRLVIRRMGSHVGGSLPGAIPPISVPPPPSSPSAPLIPASELPMLVRPAGSGIPTAVETFSGISPPPARSATAPLPPMATSAARVAPVLPPMVAPPPRAAAAPAPSAAAAPIALPGAAAIALPGASAIALPGAAAVPRPSMPLPPPPSFHSPHQPPPPPAASHAGSQLPTPPVAASEHEDDDEATAGTGSTRPRRGPRTAAYRSVRRTGSSTRISGAPPPETVDEITSISVAPQIPSRPPEAPRVPSRPPAPPPAAPAPAAPPPVAAPAPPPPPMFPKPAPITPAAAAPSPAVAKPKRDLDDDFSYLKGSHIDDVPPQRNPLQIIAAMALVATALAFIMWVKSDHKQQRIVAPIPMSSRTSTKARSAAWPVAAARSATVTTPVAIPPIAVHTASIAAKPTAPPKPATDPVAIQADLDRGLVALRKERSKDAEAAYAAVLTVDPNNAAAHAGLGHALLLRGRDGDAMKEAKTALAASDKNGHAHLVLGFAFSNAGRNNEANDHFRRFLQLDPSSPFAPEIRKFLQAQP